MYLPGHGAPVAIASRKNSNICMGMDVYSSMYVHMLARPRGLEYLLMHELESTFAIEFSVAVSAVYVCVTSIAKLKRRLATCTASIRDAN